MLAGVIVASFGLAGCETAGNVGSTVGGAVGGSMQTVFGGMTDLALGGDPGNEAPGEAEIGRALREALTLGTDRVVATLGTEDGYYGRSDVRIALPGALAHVDQALGAIGMNQLTEDLELRLNRAAEAAVPRAKILFWEAIADMRIDDIMAIYRGPDDAATQYFQGRMAAPLARDMYPIVDRTLSEVGAIAAYNRAIARYRNIPGMPDVKAELIDYVLDRAIEGVFLYLGAEEARIRENPSARTTALLRRVFGGAM
ncbi:MAG: DUF4197 domain-containing protein [Alphaproteobacteria bacterium]|nr:DUF4197 domain-containing protein [Alphaproteobacteria bacterium]